MPRRSSSTRQSALLESPEFLRLALAGVEREIEETRERLATLQAYAAQLREPRGTRAGSPASKEPAAPAATPPTKRRRRNRLSPEARKRLSERMKKRWAEYRKDQPAAEKTGTRKSASKSAGAKS